jgi:glycosyltransferase involved in cell wall biosynthesis
LDAIDLVADRVDNPDLKITFLGKSVAIHGQDANEYIQNRASAWPFTVKIVNHYDRATALKYLTTHGRLAVMPSLIENTPYVVYEALVLNLPFIATDTETVRDLIAESDQSAALVDRSAEALAAGLIKALANGVIRPKPAFTAEHAKNSWRYFYNYAANMYASVSSKVNRNPLVSICVVHYNRPALLKQTLESIYAQQYTNIEVILVDDGSTDVAAIAYLQSLESQFYSRGWKVIFSENRYLGAARNLAARNAEGEFLFFLDDDNLIKTSTINTYVRVALQTGSPLLTAAHDVFKGLKIPTEKDFTERWVPLGGSVAVGLFKNSFGDANFFVSKKGFLEIGGFSEDRGVGLEDHEFHAKWVLSGKQMEVIPEALLYYRMHDKQNQMVFSTDPLLNQFRYLRSYSEVFDGQATDMFRFINAKRDVSISCNETIVTSSPTISDLGGTIYFTGVALTCASPYVVTFDGTSFTCVVNNDVTDTSFSCTSVWFEEPFPASGETDITVQFLNGDSIKLSIEVVPTASPVLIK